MDNIRKIGVLTSGGDSPGMNAAIRAVVRFGIDLRFEVYGIERGFTGLIEGDVRRMDRFSVADILQRGGTILKTARSEKFMTKEGFSAAVENIGKFGLDALIVIGGNGSLKGAKALADAGVRVAFIPASIDNDLGYTEASIGFDTAVNTVLDAITRIRDTSSAHERTTVIEVMGRDCGDIALYSGVAGGAEFVLLPEVKTDIEDMIYKVTEGIDRGKMHSIIIRAEGAEPSSDETVRQISQRTGRDVRLVVLSYLQRGGSPTLRDRLIATDFARAAVEIIRTGGSGFAVGLSCGGVTDFPIEEAISYTKPFERNVYEAIDILSR